MRTQYSFWIIFLLFPVNFLKAGINQNNDTLQESVIVDSVTGRSISFVHIVNESTRRGYITDSTGKFKIRCKKGDTLVFISLGYLGKVVIVDSLPHQISLVPRTYKIDEVSIESYRSYNQFKKDFLELEAEKAPEIQGLPKGKPIDIPVLLDTNHINSPAFLVLHPLSYLYYKFSKEEKSKRKAFYLERQAGERVIIERKFNREIVSRITGLEDEELTNFIGFCNFSHPFLFEATELEIVKEINKKRRIPDDECEKDDVTTDSVMLRARAIKRKQNQNAPQSKSRDINS